MRNSELAKEIQDTISKLNMLVKEAVEEHGLYIVWDIIELPDRSTMRMGESAVTRPHLNMTILAKVEEQ